MTWSQEKLTLAPRGFSILNGGSTCFGFFQFELHLNGIEANDEMYKLVESVEDDSPTSALAQQVSSH